MRSPDRLLERIRNDRYAEDQVSHGGDPVIEPRERRAFNQGSEHVESLFLRWMNEARMPVVLAELAEAPAMDMRLKNTLILGVVEPEFSRLGLTEESALPVASQETGAVNPLSIERAPTLATAATPTAGEVVGDFSDDERLFWEAL